MEKELENWKSTCNRLIAFLDIMGFRDMIFRKRHGDVMKMLESLHPAVKFIEDHAKQDLKRRVVKSPKGEIIFKPSFVFPVSFSDSIILISNDDSEGSVIMLFSCVEWIFTRAILKGIPMKGAVAYGKLTAELDKSIYFGKPLIDAYELQNELEMYGIVLHHTLEKYLCNSKLKRKFENSEIFKYRVPMKSGKISHYLIDWTGELYLHRKPQDFAYSKVSKLYNNVSGKPRLYVDNTLEFLDWLKKELSKYFKNETS